MMRSAPSRLDGQDGAQADRPVADHRHRVALLHAGADRRVVPGRHHVGQGEQRPQRPRLSGLTRHAHQGAARQRYPDGLALAAVDRAVAEVAAQLAGDRRAVLAVRAGHVAVDERRHHQVPW